MWDRRKSCNQDNSQIKETAAEKASQRRPSLVLTKISGGGGSRESAFRLVRFCDFNLIIKVISACMTLFPSLIDLEG